MKNIICMIVICLLLAPVFAGESDRIQIPTVKTNAGSETFTVTDGATVYSENLFSRPIMDISVNSTGVTVDYTITYQYFNIASGTFEDSASTQNVTSTGGSVFMITTVAIPCSKVFRIKIFGEAGSTSTVINVAYEGV